MGHLVESQNGTSSKGHICAYSKARRRSSPVSLQQELGHLPELKEKLIGQNMTKVLRGTICPLPERFTFHHDNDSHKKTDHAVAKTA